MKFIKHFFKAYFNSWWIPLFLLILLSVLNTSLLMASMKKHDLAIYVAIYGYFLQIFVFGLLAAGIWNLYKRRWKNGIANIFFILFPMVVMYGIFGTSEDNFAKDLTIPSNIKVFEPKERQHRTNTNKKDTFQIAIFEALKNKNDTNGLLDTGLTSLVKLKRKYPKQLFYYLSAHPAWRVFEKNGKHFATRRWMINNQWSYVLHGYYTQYDTDSWSGEKKIHRFQSRVTIGLDGTPWATSNAFSGTTEISFGSREYAKSTNALVVQKKKSKIEKSDLLVKSKNITLEIFEESTCKGRCMTRRVLEYLDHEFSTLLYTVEYKSNSVRSLIPKSGSSKKGKALFDLTKTGSPGIYTMHLWVNPGEAGRIYLKAYEVTHGTPLSINSLKKYSNEWVGYSTDSSELFLANGEITIYEGDWGDPYAARFEVWFEPDSGKAERKLLDKVFKIEGWQR